MRVSKLQLFAEAVQGKKIIYLYRVKEESATEDAMQLAFTTENGRTKSKDADSTATKDGSIRTPGVAEVEITATSILSKGDTLMRNWKPHWITTSFWRSGKLIWKKRERPQIPVNSRACISRDS